MYFNMIAKVYVVFLTVLNFVSHIDWLKVTAILLSVVRLIFMQYYSYIKYPFYLLRKTRNRRLYRRRCNVRRLNLSHV